MDYKDLANLIFPNVKDIKYYEEKYPERNLPEGAMVVRVAPSPTGNVHIGTIYQAFLNCNCFCNIFVMFLKCYCFCKKNALPN